MQNDILHAARLSRLPGSSVAEACRRTGLSRRAVAAARKSAALAGFPSLHDLLLAALTQDGRESEGEIPGDLSSIAGFIDWQNHDGCTAGDVQRLMDEIVKDGGLACEEGRWRLLRPWP